MAVTASSSAQPSALPYRDALGVWLRVALQSFGGPAGQIAVMHRILVEEKRWVSETRFLHALLASRLPGCDGADIRFWWEFDTGDSGDEHG